MRYAIVKDNLVINVVSWDKESDWRPPEDTEMIEIKEGQTLGINYQRIEGQWVAPPLTGDEV